MKPLYFLLYLGTVALLVAGAQVQVLKSALVCPDWPLCYGEFLPLYMTPVFYESLHRFLAFIVGTGSVLWAFIRFKDIRFRSFLPLFLITIQSMLGWATFVYKLPTITTVLHLILSLLFLASLEGTCELKYDEDLRHKWNPKLKDVVGFFLFFLVLQIVLGGLLRKSSLLASCEGNLSFWSCWQKQAEIPLAGPLSLLHRFMGLFTTLSGFFVMSYLIKHLPKWKWVAAIGLMSLVSQLILGIQMGRSSSRQMILFHFIFALASFCSLLFLVVRLRRHEKYFFGVPVATYLNDVVDLFKPKLTILVVITLLIGVLVAPLEMNLIYIIISLVAIWLQAAGSLSINCYIERDVDKLMERTKDRPLPAGRLAPEVALYWGWSFILIGTVVLTFTANLLTASLGLFSALSYIYVYTPMKLKSPYALYVGAIPGALPTLMGWTTMTNSIGGIGPYLFGSLFLWQIPHFMAISLYRKSDYTNAGVVTFAQTHSKRFLHLNIFFYSLIMFCYGLLPYYWGWRSDAYLVSSLMIGGLFTLGSCFCFVLSGEKNLLSWARAYFFSTLFYLPLQLGSLLILR